MHWAERCFLDKRLCWKVHGARPNSPWPLFSSFCQSRDLHAAPKASLFCWVRDWQCMFQRIITWGCGGDCAINPNWKVRLARLGRCAGCSKGLAVRVWKYWRELKETISEVPPESRPTQSFPPLITPFLPTCVTDSSLNDMEKAPTLSQCLEGCWVQFSAIEVYTLLYLGRGRACVTMKMSLIRLHLAGFRMLKI